MKKEMHYKVVVIIVAVMILNPLLVNDLVFSEAAVLTDSNVSDAVLNSSILENLNGNFPSEMTPFNITTYLKWDPWMFEPPTFMRDIMLVNDSVFSKKGLKQPFYMTLLPMHPNVTSLNYTITVENFEGPTNLSILFAVELHVGERIVSSGGTFSQDSTIRFSGKSLNTSRQRTISGMIVVNTTVPPDHDPNLCCFYDYEYVRGNMSERYAYSLLSVQPFPENPNSIWNHALYVKVSVSGWEDRSFFNAMRTARDLPPWDAKQFRPFSQEDTCCEENNGIRKVAFGPMHQKTFTAMDTREMTAWEFEMPPNESVMTLNMSVQSTSFVRLGINLKKTTISTGASTSTYLTIITPILVSSSNVSLKYNWKLLQGLNNYSGPDHVTFYSVEVFMRAFDNSSWDEWANLTVAMGWKPDIGEVKAGEFVLDVSIPQVPSEESRTNNSSSGTDTTTTITSSSTTTPLEILTIPMLLTMVSLSLLIRRRKRR